MMKKKERIPNKKIEKERQKLLQEFGNFWKTKPNCQTFYNVTAGFIVTAIINLEKSLLPPKVLTVKPFAPTTYKSNFYT